MKFLANFVLLLLYMTIIYDIYEQSVIGGISISVWSTAI